MLTHLRAEVVRAKGKRNPEALGMAALAWILREPHRYEVAQKAGSLTRLLARNGRISRLPGPGARWTAGRDAPVPPAESFRAWWKRTHA